MANLKNSYKDNYIRFTKNENFEVSDNFYDYKKTLAVENEKYLFLTPYTYFIGDVFEIPSKDKTINGTFKNIAMIKNEKIRTFFTEKQLLYFIPKKGTDAIKKYYEAYLKTPGYKVKQVQDYYNKGLKIAKGNPAIDFTAQDVNGKSVSLSDFNDKLVYIDVWSTLCGPCKKEIPFLKKLEKKYHKNKNIVFMSVSLDKDANEDKWKKMIVDKELKGVQLRIKGKLQPSFTTDYLIYGIPRFILVKNGNIITSNAPRPSSNEEIEKLINDNI